MNKETEVKYLELENGSAKLQQIEADLDNAKLQRKKMCFIKTEVGGFTAGQAVYGFSSIYDDLIGVTRSLTKNTESFLADVGVAFKAADDASANEIKK